jgi:hypothetical protein
MSSENNNTNTISILKRAINALLPEIGSPMGFIFYSSLCYALIMWISWMAKGTVADDGAPLTDEEFMKRAEIQRLKERGMRMR